MTTDQTTITVEVMQQMFLESEKRLEKKLNKKFDKLEGVMQFLDTKIEHKFKLLDARIDGLETRFDNLENRFDILEIKIDKRFDSMAKGFLEFTSVTFDDHNNRITALEQKNHSLITPQS